jgi:hypothetical protein
VVRLRDRVRIRASYGRGYGWGCGARIIKDSIGTTKRIVKVRFRVKVMVRIRFGVRDRGLG